MYHCIAIIILLFCHYNDPWLRIGIWACWHAYCDAEQGYVDWDPNILDNKHLIHKEMLSCRKFHQTDVYGNCRTSNVLSDKLGSLLTDGCRPGLAPSPGLY